MYCGIVDTWLVSSVTQQLERHAENLEKCYEAEIAAERDKQKETQAELEVLSQQTQVAKDSMQVRVCLMVCLSSGIGQF